MRIVAVVPAHNAADDIGACLDGLLAAGFAPGDVMLVDDGSSDDTVAVARGRGVGPLIEATNAGAAAARNRGAREAGDAAVLLFVDADVVPASDARDAVIRFFEAHPDHAAVFGAYDENPAVRTVVSRFRNLLHRFVHVRGAGEAVTFWTGLGAVRRAAFEAVGGFDPDQRMLEDIRLGLALHAAGHRIRLDPRLAGQHRKGWTVWSMCRTDLVDRAIPWARLLRTNEGRASAGVLNLGGTARASGLAVAASLLAAPLAPRRPRAAAALALGSTAALAIVNRHFLQEQRRLFGRRQAAATMPLLWLHYGCGGAGFAWVASGTARAGLASAARRVARTLRGTIARR